MKTLILPLLMILSSCGGDDFRKVEELDGFRILGIQASTPEVSPAGGDVNLSFIVSDPNGGGRTLNGEYQTCIDPGVAEGADVSCDWDPSSTPTPLTLNTAGLAGTMFTGIVAGPSVTVPANVLDGRSPRDQFNGVGYIVIFRFDVDGQSRQSFKRIIVTNRGTLNNNPVANAGSMTLNGAGVTAKPQKNDKLKITNPTPETYDFITVEGKTETRSEEYQVAWYVTSGKFNKPKADITEEVEYDEDPPASSMVVLALIRDERGGLAVSQNFIP